MGTDREARAMAAGQLFTVDGVEYRLRPVVIQNLCDLEMDALDHYKRQYLKTFRDNTDLLGDGEGTKLLVEKMQEAAGWTIQDLPQKAAYDVSRIPITDKVKKWALAEYGIEETEDEESSERMVRALLAASLDMRKITPEKVKAISGKRPLEGRVRYDQWWVTSSTAGMISFIHNSVRMGHPNVTKETIGSWPYVKILEAVRVVESLTSASLGNG